MCSQHAPARGKASDQGACPVIEIVAAVDYLAGRPALLVLMSVVAIIAMVIAAPLLAPVKDEGR